jgi:PAS domain S-box-containing protein
MAFKTRRSRKSMVTHLTWQDRVARLVRDQGERWTVRRRMIGIVLALAVPLNIIFLVVLWYLASSWEAAQRASLMYAARSVATAVDAQLRIYISFAQVLSRSPALAEDTLDAFEAEARRAVGPEKDFWVVVADPQGRQLMNLFNPHGLDLARPVPVFQAAQDEAFKTHAIVISDIGLGPVSQRWGFTVEAPVFRNGQPFRTLALAVPSGVLLNLLNAQDLPKHWRTTIIDRTGRKISRQPDNEAHVGQLAVDDWRENIGVDGISEYKNSNADRIISAHAQSQLSGWSISVAIGKKELDVPISKATNWAIAYSGSISLASLALAFILARGVTRPIEELRQRASEVIVGIAPSFQPRLPEIKDVWATLTKVAAERHRSEATLRQREQHLRLALEASSAGTWSWDVDSNKVVWDGRHRALFGFTLDEPPSFEKWLARIIPDDRPGLMARIEELKTTPSADVWHEEFRFIHPERGERWAEELGHTQRDARGLLRALTGITLDITDRKRAEEHQKVLMAELDHRVKNVLARVVAVAQSTRRGSGGVDEFIPSFRGRIQSMAAAHELLSQTSWQGADLTALVRKQLAPYATDSNMTIAGTDIALGAAATQGMAMVLHELVTNAVKHGALSIPGGRVSVSWDRRLNRSAANLILVWRELGGPPVAAANQSSYGIELIRGLIPYELDGKVDLVFAPDGVYCRIEFPLER